jgi:hypothetical protein
MYFHHATLKAAFRAARRPVNASWRHLLLGYLFIALFLLLRTMVWCVRGLDRIFYPGYRRQALKAPIFIIGNPRSGTTFTHRLMAKDDAFTHFKLVDTIFPAVCFYRIFSALAKIDRRMGAPLGRHLNRISDKGFEGWQYVHKTGPQEAESDEMLFVYTMLSPLLCLLFPYFNDLPYACMVDKLPRRQRDKIMRYYADSLQRHLFATGPDKILLQKVALIAGRLGSILEVLPDMRLVHLVRHPYQSIPSLISMFAIPWSTLAPRAVQSQAAYQALAELIFNYYRYLYKIKQQLPPQQFLEIRYDDLVKDPQKAIERVYTHFDLPLSPRHRLFLQQASRRAKSYQSRHSYTLEQFGLSREKVYHELQEVFEAYGFER